MKKKAIVLLMTGMTAFCAAEQAAAANITGVSRGVQAMDGVNPVKSESSTAAGYWGSTVFQYSPSGLPPVSAASQGSFVGTLDGGSSLVFAGSSQGGWGQVSANVFRPGGAASSWLLLGFTVDTNAAWSWIGGAIQTAGDGDFAAVSLLDVDTQATIFSDQNSSGTSVLSGSLLAGHNYLFSIEAAAAFSRAIDGNSGFADGSFKVTEVTQAVPEPETYAMLMAGLGVLGAVGRRRKKA